MVSRERLFLSVLGALYLTDQRLIFLPYLYTLSWSPVVLDIADIDCCGEASIPSYRNLAHLVLSIGWYVQVGGHRHFFVSLGQGDKEAWLRAISSVANVPVGQRRAF